MKCVSPINISKKVGGRLVSCGQCYGCRFRKKRDWAIRLTHESEMHEDKCFLTLTFNDENLPKNQSLDKKFISDFIKCLREDMRRKKLPKIRYFLCGEYGSICNLCGNGKKHCKCKNNTYTLGRPHYHAIIFGYDFADRNKPIAKTPSGHTLYEGNELLNSNWKYGFSTVGSVTIDSCRYVSHYILKKSDLQNKQEFEKENPGKIMEFSTMSKGRGENKGIGYRYYSKHLSPTYKEGYGLEFRDKTMYKDIPVSLPKYYRSLNRNIRKFLPKKLLNQQLEIRENNIEYNKKIYKKSQKTKRRAYDIFWSWMKQIELNGKAKEQLYVREEKL